MKQGPIVKLLCCDVIHVLRNRCVAATSPYTGCYYNGT